VGLELSNPKNFLPLLLFIGFVFALFGKGWEGLGNDSGMYSTGLLMIFLAILLWVVSELRK
jgi:hypothetical protein